MNIQQLIDTLPFLIKAKLTPNIVGAHGIGKSSVVKQFAEKNGYSFHP
jgi:predicted AAA+ superfamily ATPase